MAWPRACDAASGPGGDRSPLIVRRVVDDAVERSNPDEVFLWGIVLVGMTLISVVLGLGIGYCTTIFQNKVLRDLRLSLYLHMQKLSLRYFADKETGWLMSRQVDDVGSLDGVMADTFARVSVDVVRGLGYIFMIFYIGMLTAPRILKDDGHTRMTVVLDMLNPRLVQMINAVTNVGAAVICGVLTWRTGLDTWRSYFTFNAIYHRGFDVHQAIIWVIMPIGFGMLTLQFLRMGYRSLQNSRQIRREEGSLADRLASARLASSELEIS